MNKYLYRFALTHFSIYCYVIGSLTRSSIVIHCSLIVTSQSPLYLDKNIHITISMECLHGTKFIVPDRGLDRDLDNFAPCKRCIIRRLHGPKLSASQSGLRPGSRFRRCTRLHRTFIVQYNKAHHLVVRCSVIVS